MQKMLTEYLFTNKIPPHHHGETGPHIYFVLLVYYFT